MFVNGWKNVLHRETLIGSEAGTESVPLPTPRSAFYYFSKSWTGMSTFSVRIVVADSLHS